ncbi:MAG: hypothetical protein C4516_09845 [Oxalobacter sp.]|nr:MAG: hypothetical protein C4516_09845 [Oxalobacter sp.]
MLRRACVFVFSFLSLLFAAQVAQATLPNQNAGDSVHSPRSASATGKAKAKQSKRQAKRRIAKPRTRMVRKVVWVKGKRKVIYVAQRRGKPVRSAGDKAGLNKTHDQLALKSNAAYIIDQASAEVLLEKNAEIALPVASITKLMTALVVLEARQDLNEVLDITRDDIDREKHSRSRLRIGARVKREDLLHIALMSSENRAASALGRNFSGGTESFVAAMNAKAKALGMSDTHFADSSGLSSRNVSSARDLAKLVVEASKYPMIRDYSTDTRTVVDTGRHLQQYANTNRLVRSPQWKIGVQKTGYISEAGRCLVMQAKIKGREIVMIFLDSKGKLSRLGDASRVRNWLVDHKLDDTSEKESVPATSVEHVAPATHQIPQETPIGLSES